MKRLYKSIVAFNVRHSLVQNTIHEHCTLYTLYLFVINVIYITHTHCRERYSDKCFYLSIIYRIQSFLVLKVAFTGLVVVTCIYI